MKSQDPNNLSGQLSAVSLPSLLVYLQKSSQTGSLDINSKFEITIFIEQGFPYFAAGGSSETLIGKILLNRNKITKYQYDKAVEEIKTNKDKRVGEILVNLGMITPHELNEFLELQVREKILETFLYLEGSYEFNPSAEIRTDLFYSKQNPSELINEGFNRYVFASDTNFDLIKIKLLKDMQDDINKLGLGPRELRLFQLLNQNKSLKDIETSGQFKRDDILRVLLLLGLHEKIDIENIEINEFLIDVFKKYSLHNPLPEPADSNYTVRESELTDPTGEILLLDDELEETDESEIPEAGDQEHIKPVVSKEIQEKNDEPADTVIEIQEELRIDETGAENAARDQVSNDKKDDVDSIDIEIDAHDKEEVSINETADNYSFQEEYEGDHESIEIDAKKPEERKLDIVENTGAQEEILNFYEHIQNEEDFYKILNVDRSATSEEIKDSYFRLIKKFHPDANTNFPEDIRVKAERIFSKVTRSYETLGDEVKRRNFDRSDELSKFREQANSIYEAEVTYTEGELLLRQRNYKEAERKFFRAIELNPDEAAYVGIYAWAKYLAVPDKELVYEEVKKELKRAIDMNENIAENYYYLGSVYKFAGSFSSAEKYYNIAVQKDPNYIEAKRELRLLQSRKGKKVNQKESGKKIEKKFWSGLFKK